MKVGRDRGVTAGRPAADALGIGLEEAAYAIYTTSNHNMVAAIEEITVREGINPRDSVFVCGGGATAIHIAEMAEILGLKRYMVPRFMAGLSAFGGLISDIRNDKSGVLLTSHVDFDLDGVNALLAQLHGAGDAFLADAGVAPENRRFEVSYMGRYEFQSFEIEVPFALPEGGLTAADLPELVEAFHRMHERIYSIRIDGDVVEFTAWKLRAIGKRRGQDAWRLHTLSAQSGAVTPKASRRVYDQPARSMIEVPVYELSALGEGARIAGPCLVESPTFTAYLKRGHEGTLDQYGNIDVTVA